MLNCTVAFYTRTAFSHSFSNDSSYRVPSYRIVIVTRVKCLFSIQNEESEIFLSMRFLYLSSVTVTEDVLFSA